MSAPGDNALHTYLLIPIAGPDDPRWQVSPSRGVVTVRAHSPADARIVASETENEMLLGRTVTEAGISNAYASAFRSEELYRVVEAPESNKPPTLDRAVIDGLGE